MKDKIRTRYAPSPTGKMHVGNLRTALYEFLIAKHVGGDFVLRIEDTDQERFVEGATEIIYRTLEKAGLTHDEGPDKDGGYGPYIQSERMKTGIYMKYAKMLIDQGDAYYCFCDEKRLESLKVEIVDGKEIRKYDKHCLSLTKEEIESKLSSGVPFVIRQNIPLEGETTFHDEIYGDITVSNSELDDMILIKSDGYPTYNFANVIDDHAMKITHVVRGNEYLSSAPKYQRLYDAFGWESPIYIHLPLITDEFHKKLSKRSGHSSFEDLIDQGFLPQAVINYIALLGWNPGNDREIFSLKELISLFDYHRIGKTPAVFDINKLRWMNGVYIKSMDYDTFCQMAEPFVCNYIKDIDKQESVFNMIKTRIETFNDIPSLIGFLKQPSPYTIDLFENKKFKTTAEGSLLVLRDILPLISEWIEFDNDTLYSNLNQYANTHNYKTGFIMWPLRIALSGQESTPAGATAIMELLGKKETILRIKKAIEFLEKNLI